MATKAKDVAEEATGSKTMQKLIDKHSFILPEVDKTIDGKIISVGKNEILIDLNGITTGMVRGPELFDESGEYNNLKVGANVTATVLELENEKGLVELSFRTAGHVRAWNNLDKLLGKKNIVDAEVVDANKGGLLVKIGGVNGFLPVSQLTIEHYPRVEGGNKNRILEKLQSYVTKKFKVRIIAVDEKEDKLIVSEKAAFEETQKTNLGKYKVDDIVKGRITGVVEFGAFIEFSDDDNKLEGLVHISELAWQRIDSPKEIVNVGDEVKAQIISIEDGRISLSIRRLQKDPWQEAMKKYKVGDVVKGKVLKTSLFGAFVELDKDIHGLVHISELSWEKVNNPRDIVEVDKEYKFKILSIEPKDHRLGLSLKALSKKDEKKVEKEDKPKKEEKPKEKMEDKKEDKREDKAKEKEAKKDEKKDKKKDKKEDKVKLQEASK